MLPAANEWPIHHRPR